MTFHVHYFSVHLLVEHNICGWALGIFITFHVHYFSVHLFVEHNICGWALGIFITFVTSSICMYHCISFIKGLQAINL